MTEKPEYIVVGRFGRSRGVSGQIYIHTLTDNPDRFAKDALFWIESNGGWMEIEVVSPEVISGRQVGRIKGISTREEVRKFTNLFLYIRKDELGDLSDGTYYHFDLVGCRVIGSDNTDYGVVAEVEQLPANNILLIKDRDGKEYRLPLVAAYILEVKTDEKEIIIDPPEGIFDSPDEN